jgi:hypothetical protein
VLGTPTPTNWPGSEKLPDFNKITFDPIEPLGLAAMLPDAAPMAVTLLEALLQFESARRLVTVTVVLYH